MLNKIMLGILLLAGLFTIVVPSQAAIKAPSAVTQHCDDVDSTAQDSFE